MVVSLFHSVFDFLAFKNGKNNAHLLHSEHVTVLGPLAQIIYVLHRHPVLEQKQVHGGIIREVCRR